MKKHLLLVCDDTILMSHWEAIVGECGYDYFSAANGMEGLIEIEMHHKEILAIVSALEMPMMTGAEMLKSLRKYHPNIPVVLSVGASSLSAAMNMMDEGVSKVLDEYFTASELKLALDQGREIQQLKKERKRLHENQSSSGGFEHIIGATGGLKKTIASASRMAKSDLPVLITGESGVGKEIFARAIHGDSQRSNKPFVAVNCGAIPRNLAESTLFGHVKGAFTGAVRDAEGKFREADGGTLFLDEVGELPLDVQVKLLRALQENEIEPVGYGQSVRTNVRIISATNVNLISDIGDGHFREDLFYRLNVLPLSLPPLRDRLEDILPLAEHFIDTITVRDSLGYKTLSEDAKEWLQRYHWPGNVREMENTLSRALLLAESDILEVQDLNSFAAAMKNVAFNDNQAPQNTDTTISLLREDGSRKTMDELYQDIIIRTLAETGDNIAHASAILDVGQSTLYRKISEWRNAGSK